MSFATRARGLIAALAISAWLVAVAACASDVDIVASCEVTTAELYADLPSGTPSIGLLEQQVLVSTVRADYDRLTVLGSPGGQGAAAWFTLEGQRVGDVVDLGNAPVFPRNAQWVRANRSLQGMFVFDPTRDPSGEVAVSVWTMSPAAAERRVVRTDLAGRGEPQPSIPTIGRGGSGAEGRFPAVAIAGRFVGGFVSEPAQCGSTLGNFTRLFLVSELDDAVLVTWGETCAPRDFELNVENAWFYDAGDGHIGVLHRPGRPVPVHLAVVSLDGSAEPRGQVGENEVSTVDGGKQPRAVRLPSGRVLMAERRSFGENECHALRMFDADGSNAEDTDYQFPCVECFARSEAGCPLTSWVDLVESPQGAIVVWEQHSFVPTFNVPPEADWEEGIYAALITNDGKRGSNIVRLTVDESTALSLPRERNPPLAGFIGGAASEGDTAVVAWQDFRQDAPGVYMRALRCVPSD